jgi:hypothetical protein
MKLCPDLVHYGIVIVVELTPVVNSQIVAPLIPEMCQ